MKKKIIFLSIFILVLAFGGIAIYYFTQTNKKPVVFAGEAKYQTYTAPAPTDGTTPLDHDAYDNIAYVLWVLEHTEKYSSLTEGSAVSVGQSQTIYNLRRVNGKEQLVDTISGGLITLGKQKYFLDNKVLLRDYVSKNGDSIVWKTDEPECITKDAYIGRYGWLPNQATAYIICKDTILEISEVNPLEDGLFSITLSLNPDKDYAPFWYQREVSTNASSISKPVFSSIQIEYIFDANWRVHQVNTKETYNVTPKVAPILVTCETNITEKFDYENYEFDASAMEFFEKYKDLVPVGGEVTPPEEETPLTYITGSLLGGSDKEKTFDLIINVNDRTITGKVLLNISDLNHVIVYANLGDLQVVYQNDEVYVDYGSIKVKCNIDEVGTMLQPLLEEIFFDTKPNEGTQSSLDLSQIMNDLNAASITETDTSVRLDLTLNLMGVSLPLVFQIEKDGKDLVLKSIQSDLNFGETNVSIQLNQNSELTFDSIEGEYNDLKDLNFIIEDITTILKNKKVSANFQASLDDTIISGVVKVQFGDELFVQSMIEVANTTLDVKDGFVLTYYNSNLYLEYGTTKVMIAKEDLVMLLQKIMPTTPSLDINKLVDSLLNVDYKSLFKQLTIQNDSVILSLDFSNMNSSLSQFDFAIQNTEIGFTVSTNVYDIQAEFDVTGFEDIVFDETEYATVSNHIELVEYLNSLIFKSSLGIHIDGNLAVDETEIGVVGDISLYLNEFNTYDIEAVLNLQIEDYNLDCKILTIGTDVYLEVLGYTIKVNTETIFDTLTLIFNEFGIEMPKSTIRVGLTELLEIVKRIKVEANSVEVDLTGVVETLGKVTLNYTIEDSVLHADLHSNLVSMNVSVQATETKKVEAPSSYYDEADILELLEYVKDIQKVVENQHVYLEVSGTYEEIGLNGYVYVDWENSLQAHSVLTIQYQNVSYEVELTYIDKMIYVSYNGNKVKMSQDTLMSYIGSIGTTTALGSVEEILEVLKSVQIDSNQVEVVLDLSGFVQELQDVQITLRNTEAGFDLALNIYDVQLSLDVTKHESIIVNDSEYTALEEYLDLVEYISGLVYKSSLGVHIDGSFAVEETTIGVVGDINLYLNESNTYDIEGVFAVTALDMTFHLKITYIDQTIFITLYDNIIELQTSDLSEVLGVVCDKFGIAMPTSSEQSNLVDGILEFVNQVTIKDNEINLSLNNFISALDLLTVSFEMVESGVHFTINIDEFVSLGLQVYETEALPVEKPTATLGKEDIYTILDSVTYLIEILKGNALHFELKDSVVSFMINDGEKKVNLCGGFDVLWTEASYQVSGVIEIEGFGIDVSIDVILDGDMLYLTISGQTIALNLSELPDFINEAMSMLSSIVPTPSTMDTPTFDGIDFSNLGLFITSNSLQASLEQFVGKACELIVGFILIEDGFNVSITGTYDSTVHFELPMVISASEVTEVVVPTEVLTQDDLLEILSYVSELYELTQEKEFNLDIATSINTDGQKVADIEGTLYIHLLENNAFDAHVNLIVNEYKNDEVVGWHQLELQVISLSTLQSLGAEFDTAMLFATYGNNPNDLSAVVKVKSTYTGIENLIQSVTQLMNLDIPVLQESSDSSNMNMNSILEYISVERSSSLSLGVAANALFPAMQDERQVLNLSLLKKNSKKLTGISASNVYVTYTNTMKYMKLDSLEITLQDRQNSFVVPTSTELEGYYDISEVSNLFEALYHNALEKSFYIAGDVVLKAKVLITITESIPVKIKVGVEENGEPIVHVNIDMNNLKAGAILASKKTVDIYYYNQYVYISRNESNSIKRVKVHINTFMDDIVYYLLDFGMGLSDTILNAIQKPTEGDGFVDAAKCINSVNIQKDTFEFGLNMGELTDNFNLEDLFISLGTSMVNKTNADGSISLVPMIHKINSFEFKMVKVITLSSTNLKLENIDEASMTIQPVDVSFIEAFAKDYGETLDTDNELLQSDIIYEQSSDGWVKASNIEHKVTFDLATSSTKLENQTASYSKDAQIEAPVVEDILEVTLEDGSMKYYQFMGWYLDASYMTPVSDEDWIMADRNKTFYGKYLDITSTVTIHSVFGEDQVITSYIGASTEPYMNLFDVAQADGKMYLFKGYQWNGIDCDTIETNEVVLDVVWQEVEFYALYDQTEKKLDMNDTTAFLTDTYYIPMNLSIGSSSYGVYYGYPGSLLTPSYIISTFNSLFKLNELANRLELEMVETLPAGNYVETTIDKGLGTKGYIPYQALESTGLAYDTFGSYEVNAWIDGSGTYYSWYDLLAKTNQNVQLQDVYISTPQKDLKVEVAESAKITGFTFDSSVTVLITPRYIYTDGKAVLVTTIGANAFFGAEEKGSLFNKKVEQYHMLETIVLHEGLLEVESNAFKNSISLKTVYLPSTLTTVATDAFYMDVVSKAETNQGYAKNVKFHILPESDLNVGDWLAYKWNYTKHYYNTSNVPNSTIEEPKSIVESVYSVLSN